MDTRTLIALPLYVVGGVLWIVAASVLLVADKISAHRFSNDLLRLR